VLPGTSASILCVRSTCLALPFQVPICQSTVAAIPDRNSPQAGVSGILSTSRVSPPLCLVSVSPHRLPRPRYSLPPFLLEILTTCHTTPCYLASLPPGPVKASSTTFPCDHHHLPLTHPLLPPPSSPASSFFFFCFALTTTTDATPGGRFTSLLIFVYFPLLGLAPTQTLAHQFPANRVHSSVPSIKTSIPVPGHLMSSHLN
jgi:hypothetical protein